jgi:1-acyl-sn-glycerol-3-phosphate acyltransferase
MVFVRSVIFAVVFHATTAIFVIVGSPLLFGPRSWAMAGLRLHAWTCLLLLRLVVGTRIEVRGRENLPTGAALIAAKHQSAWETFALIPYLRDPAIVMKAELGHIPFYGWFSRKFGHILVARDRGPSALKDMIKLARERAAEGRHVVIFPEGTRRPVGAEPSYKPGVLALYEALDRPCVPVALNSGVLWRNRSIMRLPGTIVVEFLAPIPPGLARAEFRHTLVSDIETATGRLVTEAEAAIRPEESAKRSRNASGTYC